MNRRGQDNTSYRQFGMEPAGTPYNSGGAVMNVNNRGQTDNESALPPINSRKNGLGGDMIGMEPYMMNLGHANANILSDLVSRITSLEYAQQQERKEKGEMKTIYNKGIQRLEEMVLQQQKSTQAQHEQYLQIKQTCMYSEKTMTSHTQSIDHIHQQLQKLDHNTQNSLQVIQRSIEMEGQGAINAQKQKESEFSQQERRLFVLEGAHETHGNTLQQQLEALYQQKSVDAHGIANRMHAVEELLKTSAVLHNGKDAETQWYRNLQLQKQEETRIYLEERVERAYARAKQDQQPLSVDTEPRLVDLHSRVAEQEQKIHAITSEQHNFEHVHVVGMEQLGGSVAVQEQAQQQLTLSLTEKNAEFVNRLNHLQNMLKLEIRSRMKHMSSAPLYSDPKQE